MRSENINLKQQNTASRAKLQCEKAEDRIVFDWRLVYKFLFILKMKLNGFMSAWEMFWGTRSFSSGSDPLYTT